MKKMIMLANMLSLVAVMIMATGMTRAENCEVPHTVTFSKNPVKVGIGDKRHSETADYPAGATPAFSHQLKATIAPKMKADEVSFDSSNATRATVAEVSRSDVADTVEVVLKVTGVTETPATAPTGDTNVQAKCHDSLIATTKVIVLKPTTRTHALGEADIVNTSKPITGGTHLTSKLTQIVTITIKDQFGAVLDGIYNGKDVVEEKFDHVTHGGLTTVWTTIKYPNNEFLDGIKLDDTGSTQEQDISPALTSFQLAQWEAFIFRPYGAAKGNNCFAFNNANYSTEGDMKLRVDGHDVTPNIHRKIVTTATDTPPVPGSTTETITP